MISENVFKKETNQLAITYIPSQKLPYTSNLSNNFASSISPEFRDASNVKGSYPPSYNTFQTSSHLKQKFNVDSSRQKMNVIQQQSVKQQSGSQSLLPYREQQQEQQYQNTDAITINRDNQLQRFFSPQNRQMQPNPKSSFPPPLFLDTMSQKNPKAMKIAPRVGANINYFSHVHNLNVLPEMALERIDSIDKNDSNDFSPLKCPTLKNDAQRQRFQVKETNEVKINRDAIDKKIVNQYKFVRTIGKGTFGKVKLAISQQNGKQYAVKVKCALDILYKEISIMKFIWHPNTIKLYEIIDCQEHERIYLVLEYADKGQLMIWDSSTHTFIRNSMLFPSTKSQESSIRIILRQLVKGLSYLHSNNIIHRDIKPQNILVSQNGVIKISDFGVSLIVNSNHNIQDDDCMNVQQGTLSFQPPEFFTDKDKKQTKKFKQQQQQLTRIEKICRLKQADVWSLGVTLFALIYNKLPFYNSNQYKLEQLIAKCNLDLPNSPEISSSLKTLLQGMLNKHVEQRLTLEDIYTDEWINQEQDQNLQQEIQINSPAMMKKKLFQDQECHQLSLFNFKNTFAHKNRNNSPISISLTKIRSIIKCKTFFIQFRKNQEKRKKLREIQKKEQEEYDQLEYEREIPIYQQQQNNSNHFHSSKQEQDDNHNNYLPRTSFLSQEEQIFSEEESEISLTALYTQPQKIKLMSEIHSNSFSLKQDNLFQVEIESTQIQSQQQSQSSQLQQFQLQVINPFEINQLQEQSLQQADKVFKNQKGKDNPPSDIKNLKQGFQQQIQLQIKKNTNTLTPNNNNSNNSHDDIQQNSFDFEYFNSYLDIPERPNIPHFHKTPILMSKGERL